MTLAACRVAPAVLNSSPVTVVGSAIASPSPRVSSAAPMVTHSPPPTEAITRLLGLLDALVLAPPHFDGYDRDLFPVWTDDDRDGCNTRFEVLIAEAVEPPTISGSCDLTGGMWRSPYDGVEVRDAAGVQIDHVVALAEAWYSGAYGWTTARREQFANDLGEPWELTAVSPNINQAKAASDPATWLPPEPEAVCPYVEAWIGTKIRWGLTIDLQEQVALETLALRCEDSTMTMPIPVP